jgi:hypothetical protein
MIWQGIFLAASIIAIGAFRAWRGYLAGGAQALIDLEPAGIAYCTQHHGILNEDDHYCDFSLDDDEECTPTPLYRLRS